MFIMLLLLLFYRFEGFPNLKKNEGKKHKYILIALICGREYTWQVINQIIVLSLSRAFLSQAQESQTT